MIPTVLVHLLVHANLPIFSGIVIDNRVVLRTIVRMKIVTDTNTFLAVALNEPEKNWLIEATVGHDLVAPAVLPYEIGNALSSLTRRKVLTESQLAVAWDVATAIPVELAAIDIRSALLLAGHFRIYAYDACFLQCSIETKCPLLTLDRNMKQIASELGIKLIEEL